MLLFNLQNRLALTSGLLLIFAIILTSCATPVAPTGGERDRSGPIVASMSPQNGTVNFRERVVRITFEDYVDRNSFRQAFQIEPNINIPFEISWRRKTATVSLL
ncbi:MAG: Ig-like domain-containing protein, partial [Balneolales bacterium]|nr:Ig-like domain-containing protein [Balneolales bacterium]